MRKDILENKDDIIKWINENRSKSFICRELSCKPETLNFWLIRFGMEYKGKQGWSKGMSFEKHGAMYYINNDLIISSHKLKNLLIDDGIKERRCEECKNTHWNNKLIPIELHHVDENRYNNKLENLLILCPNCHAQKNGISKNIKNEKFDHLNDEIKKLNKIEYTQITKINYKKITIDKKIKKEKINKKYFCECGKEIEKRSIRCPYCDKIRQRKVKERPPYEELMKMVSDNGYEAIGRKYGVTGKSIKKWLKQYNNQQNEMV